MVYSVITSAIPAMIYSAQGRAIALPSAKQRAWLLMGSSLQPYAVQPSGRPMSRSHSKGADKTVLLFSLIPECEGLTYTGKQSWEGFAVSAETRAETFLIALLCH